jgi:hypothetical protein
MATLEDSVDLEVDLDAPEEELDDEILLDEQASDPANPLPGTPDAQTLDLSEDEQQDVANFLCELVSDYDVAMQDRWELYDEIYDNYKMKHDSTTAGLQPNGAKAVSEYTKSFVDQAEARISAMVLGTDPLIQVMPIGEGEDDDESREAQETAEAMQDWIHAYLWGPINIEEFFPKKIKRCAMFSHAVTYDMWEEVITTVKYHDLDGKVKPKTDLRGRITTRFIPFKDFILWPLAIEDWQKDYEMVGHKSRLKKWAFRDKCFDMGVPKETVEDLIGKPGGEGDDRDDEDLERHDVDAGASDELGETYELVEIWYNGSIEELPNAKYQFVLHIPTRTLLYWNHNSLHCQKHPYHEFIYKRTPDFALGEGIGEETRQAHKIDSSLMNLEIDNAKVIGNSVILVQEESGMETFLNDLYPGKRVPVDDVEAAAKPLQLGNPLDMIHDMQDRNYNRAISANSLASVLQGLGDPTMKSGADVGSTLALIEEAGKKFGHVDAGIKTAFAREVTFWVQLVQQFAPNGIWYEKLSSEKAMKLEKISFEPPRGPLEEQFRIVVRAPSAATNKTSQKQHLMIMLQLTGQHLAELERLGSELYQGEGLPNMILDIKRQVFDYRNEIFMKLLEVHDLPGLKVDVPSMRPPTPPEQQVAMLMRQVQQMQLQNLTLQFQLQGMDPQQAQMAAQEQMSGGQQETTA